MRSTVTFSRTASAARLAATYRFKEATEPVTPRSSRNRWWIVALLTPARSISAMYSRCLSKSGQVTCRSRVSVRCGNHALTSGSQSAWLIGGPPGTNPAAIAGST